MGRAAVFSSEADAGSREEDASKRESRAPSRFQPERKWLWGQANNQENLKTPPSCERRPFRCKMYRQCRHRRNPASQMTLPTDVADAAVIRAFTGIHALLDEMSALVARGWVASIETKVCKLDPLTGEYAFSRTPEDTRRTAAAIWGRQRHDHGKARAFADEREPLGNSAAPSRRSSLKFSRNQPFPRKE